jgi:hypothetical protein
MIEKILKAAAVPSQAARFPDPPELHAVYFDSTTAEGADLGPALSITHDCIVELYAPSVSAGNDAKRRICEELDALGIRFTTQGWYWLSDIRRYQEIIEFTYIEKT